MGPALQLTFALIQCLDFSLDGVDLCLLLLDGPVQSFCGTLVVFYHLALFIYLFCVVNCFCKKSVQSSDVVCRCRKNSSDEHHCCCCCCCPLWHFSRWLCALVILKKSQEEALKIKNKDLFSLIIGKNLLLSLQSKFLVEKNKTKQNHCGNTANFANHR